MVNFLMFQGINCCSDCQVGFICICWVNVEGNVMVENIGDVLCLVWCVWFNYVVFGFDIDCFVVFWYVFCVLFQYFCFFNCKVDLFWFDILNLIVYWGCIDIQVMQNVCCSGDVNWMVGQFKVVVVVIDFDVEMVFELFDVVIKWVVQV